MKILNDDEQAAMDAVNAAMQAVKYIGNDRLRANGGELVAAIHVLQGFVTQHALERLDPENWGSWYVEKEGSVSRPSSV